MLTDNGGEPLKWWDQASLRQYGLEATVWETRMKHPLRDLYLISSIGQQYIPSLDRGEDYTPDQIDFVHKFMQHS